MGAILGITIGSLVGLVIVGSVITSSVRACKWNKQHRSARAAPPREVCMDDSYTKVSYLTEPVSQSWHFHIY